MKYFSIGSIDYSAVLQPKLIPALFLVASTFSFTTAISAAELVFNGGFEDPVVETDKGWATYYGENQPLDAADDCPGPEDPSAHACNDDVRVPGWSVFWTDDLINHEQLEPGRLEIQRGDVGGTPPYDGSDQKAELDSHHRQGSDNNNVTIAQLLPTCPLSAYTLNYAWKSRTTEKGDNDVRVVVDGNLVNIHMQNLDWEEETVHFISDGSAETLLLFGSIGTETTTGMYLDQVSVTGPDGSVDEPCTLVETLICGDKPFELTLRYDGDDDSNHSQSGNEVVIFPEDVLSFPANATIKVFGHKKKNPKHLGDFNVAIGGFFSVSGPRNRIPPRLTFEIFNSKDEFVQSVTFHTSCSQPLNAGDEFGAITVWSAIN